MKDGNRSFARLRDEKVTIIILGNKYNSNIYKAATKAYNFFGDYDQKRNNKDDDSEEFESLARARAAEKGEKLNEYPQSIAQLK